MGIAMMRVMPNLGLSIKLSSNERTQLQQLEYSHGTPQQVALRCRIILGALAGEDNVSIAEELEVSRATVQPVAQAQGVSKNTVNRLWQLQARKCPSSNE
jgi:hypothetical protein